jgi:hypothetical protein
MPLLPYKRSSKHWLAGAFAGILLSFSAFAENPESRPSPLLERPLEEAVAASEASKRFLYVAFLGEGWSLASDRFEERILKSGTFRAFAAEQLELFPVKARRKPKLNKAEVAQLQALVIHFDIKEYPTLILLAPDGTEWLRHGYKDIGPREYVEALKGLLPESAARGDARSNAID